MIDIPFASFSETAGAKIAVVLLTLTTAITSGIAGYKIIQTVSGNPTVEAKAVEVKDREETSTSGTSGGKPTAAPRQGSQTGRSAAPLAVAVSPTVLPTLTQSPVPNRRCIITISQNQYQYILFPIS